MEHFGGAVDGSIDEEYEGILKQKIFTVNTDLHNDKDYNEIFESNKRHIEDTTLDRKVYMTVNKELNDDFTYKDLKDLIVQAVESPCCYTFCSCL